MFLNQIELEKKAADMTQKEGCVLIFRKGYVTITNKPCAKILKGKERIFLLCLQCNFISDFQTL